MKRFSSLALTAFFVSAAAFFVPAAALAAGAARYRIFLRDGTTVLSANAPVRNGSVLIFRAHPGGRLTGLPEELVVRVQPGAGAAADDARVLGSRPRAIEDAGEIKTGLEPGEILVLGPTGEGAGPAATGDVNAAGNAAANPGVAPIGSYGGNTLPRTGNPPVLPLDTQTQTSPNGFPATATTLTSTPAIGPNGTPVLVPGTTAPNVGPNGAPVIGAGTVNPNVGPNGAPVLAQPGQPGATQPAIGPNGAPILATPGQPGATAPGIGPNGQPVLAAPGQPGSAPVSTAPNGTPAAPPPAASAGPPGN